MSNDQEPIAFTEGRSFTCLGLKTKNAHETDFFCAQSAVYVSLLVGTIYPEAGTHLTEAVLLRGNVAMVLGCRA